MGARLLLNLVLLALVAALAFVLLREPAQEAAAPPAALTDLDASAISRVRIEPRDGAAVELVRRDGSWWLTTPWPLPASEFKVMSVLGLATVTSHARLPVAADTLPRFGLAPPRVVLRLDDTELAFGDTEPLDGRRYVRVGASIHLVTDRHYHHLSGGAAAFVHPAPLGPHPRIARIALPDLTLEQIDGTWRATPAAAASGADAPVQLAERWRDAQAIAVVAWSEADSAPEAWVEVSVEGEAQPRRFGVVRGAGELLLVRPELGLAWRLSADSGERLLQLPAPATGKAPD